MKEGDIILINDELAEIVEVQYRTAREQKLTKKNPWWKPDEYTDAKVKKLDMVAWKVFGKKTEVYTSEPEIYDWQRMKAQAAKIINQVKSYLDEDRKTT